MRKCIEPRHEARCACEVCDGHDAAVDPLFSASPLVAHPHAKVELLARVGAVDLVDPLSAFRACRIPEGNRVVARVMPSTDGDQTLPRRHRLRQAADGAIVRLQVSQANRQAVNKELKALVALGAIDLEYNAMTDGAGLRSIGACREPESVKRGTFIHAVADNPRRCAPSLLPHATCPPRAQACAVRVWA